MRKGKIDLKKGWHDFKATHFENAGGASMIVKWQGMDTDNKMVLLTGFHDGDEQAPPPPPAEAPANPEPQYAPGFIARFWFFNKGTNQDGYKTEGIKASLKQEAKNINFVNDAAFQKLSPDFPADHFTGTWIGKVQIKKPGKYIFITRSDDGSRLWINDKQIVDNWGLHGSREKKGRIHLKAGFHDFRASHFENAGGASMIVTYIGPDTEDKPILLEGFHDEVDDQPPMKEAPEACEGDEEGIYSPGFIASYWFFERGTNFDGYKTENVEPNLVKVTESINFENDASFKQESPAFPNDHFSC
jgi:hypothetical protein